MNNCLKRHLHFFFARHFQKIRLIFIHPAYTVYSYSNPEGEAIMYTHSLKPRARTAAFNTTPASAGDTPHTEGTTGLISELTYSENQPGMTQMLLLPLLQQLGTQSRWQLWLTPQQKLSRSWLLQSGLPLDKVMQVSQSGAITTVEAMIKALQTGNYSVVLGWLPGEITLEDRLRLQHAASAGHALGLIMRPDRAKIATSRPCNGLKIHSTLYH